MKSKKVSLKDVIEFKKTGANIFDEDENKEPVYNALLENLISKIEIIIDKPISNPQINVEPSNVNVTAPGITVLPSPVYTARKWKFTIDRSTKTGLLETVIAERME